MPKLIKNGELAQDHWAIADPESFDFSQLNEGQWLVSISLFEQAAEQGFADFDRLGLLLNSDDDVLRVKPWIKQVAVIAINFHAFADGRSFSQARVLRDQLDYSGEIRAVGAYMQDQLFYLARCGVDAFLLPDETNVESALISLSDFSEVYQAACDEPQPLFRRRV